VQSDSDSHSSLDEEEGGCDGKSGGDDVQDVSASKVDEIKGSPSKALPPVLPSISTLENSALSMSDFLTMFKQFAGRVDGGLSELN
jgi:hypothetical protein